RAGIWPAPLTYGNPGTLQGFVYVVLAQQFRGSLGTPLAEISTNIAAFVDLVVAQLGPLAPVVPFAAIVAATARPRYLLLTARTRLDNHLGDVTTVIDTYLGRRPVYIIRPYDEMLQLDPRYVLQALPDSISSGLSLVIQPRPTSRQ